MTKQEFLNVIIPAALKAEALFQTPAQLIVAVAAFETGWGVRPIGNNFFGMKKAVRHTMGHTVPTREVFTRDQYLNWRLKNPGNKGLVDKLPDGKVAVVMEAEFADYTTVEAGAKDYAWLISNGRPYRDAWEAYKSSGDLAALVSKVGEYLVDIARESAAYIETWNRDGSV